MECDSAPATEPLRCFYNDFKRIMGRKEKERRDESKGKGVKGTALRDAVMAIKKAAFNCRKKNPWCLLGHTGQ